MEIRRQPRTLYLEANSYHPCPDPGSCVRIKVGSYHPLTGKDATRDVLSQTMEEQLMGYDAVGCVLYIN